jgi:hypothetical protein
MPATGMSISRSVPRIVAAHAKHVAAAADAREEQGSGRRKIAGKGQCEPLFQFVGGGLPVTQVELDDRVRRDARADPERAVVWIETEDVAHQEIAGANRPSRARSARLMQSASPNARGPPRSVSRRADRSSFGGRPSSSLDEVTFAGGDERGSPTGRQPWASTESMTTLPVSASSARNGESGRP